MKNGSCDWRGKESFPTCPYPRSATAITTNRRETTEAAEKNMISRVARKKRRDALLLTRERPPSRPHLYQMKAAYIYSSKVVAVQSG